MSSTVVLMGSGRSGSNRLLDIFDLSPQTICRNEVAGHSGGDFHGIPGRIFPEDVSRNDIASVARAITRARMRRGSRDRFDRPDKAYFTPLARPWLFFAAKRKLRRTAHAVGLMKEAEEWQVPRIALRQPAVDQSTLVLKFNAFQSWLDAFDHVNDDLRVIHNIRNPTEFLNSWYNRWYALTDRDTFAQAFPDVPRILAYFGRDDADRLSDLSYESILEIELWRWRFLNERLFTAFSGGPLYQLVTYADIDRDSVAAARRLFNFADVPFTSAVADGVEKLENKLFAKKHSAQIDPALSGALVDKVLAGSPLLTIKGLKTH